ncbi:putative amidohydrolase orfA [Mycobacteroides abscessus subsp. abscessus]|nr:putative amidohydrolase orfA [Mycobacteroides abscessus subsp. abscessus]
MSDAPLQSIGIDRRMPESAFDPAPVRQIWQELGIPGIVDVHTHFMPKSVMDKVWAYFDSAGPLVGRPWPITYRADESQRVTTLRDFGRSGRCLLPDRSAAGPGVGPHRGCRRSGGDPLRVGPGTGGIHRP